MVRQDVVYADEANDQGDSMSQVIDTSAETIEETPAQRLALAVAKACSTSARGNPTAQPSMPEELADPDLDVEVIRDAIRATMLPSWKKSLPLLDARLDSLNKEDARFLLVLAMTYYALGRIQGTIEERAKNADDWRLEGYER